jgi:hypothetical protein
MRKRRSNSMSAKFLKDKIFEEDELWNVFGGSMLGSSNIG